MREKVLVLITAIGVFFLLSDYTIKAKQEGKIRSRFLFFMTLVFVELGESKRSFFSYQKVLTILSKSCSFSSLYVKIKKIKV